MIDELAASFPPAMQKSHAQAIQDHQLRGEIIATELANRIVNRLGIIHPFELAEEAGCSLADLSSAFVIAERLFDVPALWRDIDSSTITESARLALLSEIAGAMRSEEHTSELQSLMRISYAVFCLKKKKYRNLYNNWYFNK